MPYIEKKYRPIFDQAVNYAIDGWVSVAKDTILFALSPHPESKRDGCLNYVFTQLLRKALGSAREIISLVITDYFLVDTSYDKLERLRGLFESMRDEILDRGWNKTGLEIDIIDNVICFARIKLQQYEKQKRKENGDLE